ncbi:MAG: Mrp/NBP35 family ATP-binding protein [Gemmatimonadetes bacterium]|nr:Mrp/NBP35 family ATP-binding protein [Gemmatimonadota bacterium]
MAESLPARIDRALYSIINPRTGMDVVRGEQVRDVATTTEGRVKLTLVLSDADDPTIARDVRKAVEAVEGVADVRVTVTAAPEWSAATATGKPDGPPQAPPTSPGRKPLPVMSEPQSAPRAVAAPTPIAFPALGRIIAVSSGKGGVGKSTVTVNLAVALTKLGRHVGVLDADIYGPDIPRMMGVMAPPPVANEKIVPLEAHGVKLMSLGFLVERDQPAIWRGPIVMKIINQFLRDVLWGRLDYLLVDMPPGTGDAQLSLVQAAQLAGAIIVTTPQEVAVGDALRGAKMFERVGVPILGVVENMSWWETPDGQKLPIFGSGGGARLALELGVPLLGEIPLYQPVREGGDAGSPIMLSAPDCEPSKAIAAVAERIDKG